VEINVRRHLALYGRVAIERQYCQRCRRFAFILEGAMACCRFPIDGAAERSRRMIVSEQRRRMPSVSHRKEQIKQQNGECLYCQLPLDGYVFRNGRATRIKIHWDHVVPYSYSQDNGHPNFVASCHVCNLIKSNLVFQTIEEARTYVMLKRETKGYL